MLSASSCQLFVSVVSAFGIAGAEDVLGEEIENNNTEPDTEKERTKGVGKKDFSIISDKEIVGITEDEVISTFGFLGLGFGNFQIDIKSDKSFLNSGLDTINSLVTQRVGDGVRQDYELDGINVKAEYTIGQVSKNKTIGGKRVKQTYTIENNTNEDQTITLTNRFTVNTDEITREGEIEKIETQKKKLEMIEKTAPVSEFAQDIGQGGLEGLDEFSNYEHTYMVGGNFTFKAGNGRNVTYDWSDAAHLNPDVQIYMDSEGQSWVEMSVSVSVNAGGSEVIDPAFGMDDTDAYNVRYDGATGGELTSAIWHSSGFKVGDVNGDKINDLVISSFLADNNGADSGSAFVIFGGQNTGNKPLSTSTNYNIRYDGPSGSLLTWPGALHVGDVNGDGLGDLILGAQLADLNGTDSGSAWVMFSTLIDDVGATTGNDKLLTTTTNYNIRYDGGATTDQFGSEAMFAGDVNGDGLSDLIIGAFNASNNGADSGSAYVMFSTLVDDVGSTTGNSKDMSTGTNYNIRYDGGAADDLFSINGEIYAGDINSDGLSDLVIGANLADTVALNSGSVYVMFSTLVDDVGVTTGNDKPLDTGTNYNIRYDGGTSQEQFSYGELTIGDVNGDGWSDLILSSILADNGGTERGSAYVMFSTLIDDVGATTGNNKAMSVGTNYNIRYDGVANNDWAGSAVVGDVNGDGLSDLIVGSPLGNTNGTDSGAAYVMFSTLIDDVGATTGNNKALGTSTNYNIRYDGAGSNHFLSRDYGMTIGDMDGDGLGDLLLSGYQSDTNGTDSGASYLIPSTMIDDVGSSTGNDKAMSSASNYAYRYDGSAAGDLMTSRRATAIGDVNGDKINDVLMGASAADTNGSNSGALWIVYGNPVREPVRNTTGNTRALDDQFTYNARYDGGAADDNLTKGGALAIGDVNGDMIGDLVLGAQGTNNNGTDSGSAYVIFGGQNNGNKPLSTSTNYNIRYDGGAAGDFLTDDGALGIGDVNGDGLGDLVLGANLADNGTADSGSVWVMFSTLIDDETGTGNNKQLNTGTNYNIRYDGGAANTFLTFEGVVGIGDVNGDGLEDLVFGTYKADNNGTDSGSAWVMFSTLIDDETGTGNNKPLNTGTNYNIRYDGVTANEFLTIDDAMSIGDVNGDGLGDLVLGTWRAANNGSNSGSAWVMFSTLIDDVGATTGNNKLLSAGTNYNIRYDGGAASDFLTNAGAIGIGDVNGDGLGDLVLGAIQAANNGANSGSAWVMFSTLIDDETGTGNNKQLNTGTNYNIRYDGGAASNFLTNYGALSIGDVNGDGLGDLVLGAEAASNNGADSGSAWVMFSTLIDDETGTGNNKPLDTGTNYNIRYDGGAANDSLTIHGIVSIGDVNGDGLGDLALGAFSASNNGANSGSAWVMFSTLIDDETGTGNNKPLNTGTNYNIRYDGGAVTDQLTIDGNSAIGDVNGDGIADLVLGTRTADNNGGSSGSAWVINGPIHNSAPVISYEDNDGSPTASSPGTEEAPAVLTRAADDDAYRWNTDLSTTNGGYNDQVFKFKAEFDYTLFNSPAFQVDWNGFGETSQTIEMYIWNFNTVGWDLITSGNGDTDFNLSGSKSGTDYVSSNVVWVRIKAFHATGGSGVETDLIMLEVQLSLNAAPTAPITVYVNETINGAQSGAVDPTVVGDITPVFSAINADPDSGDIADKYWIIAYSNVGCSTIVWDSGSGGTAMANTTEATRSPDIDFGGTALPLDGSLYYWKIKFWDDDNTEGAFSDCTDTFTMAGPGDQLRHGGHFFNKQTESVFSW